MIDIQLIRTNPELVRENIRTKFQDRKLPLVDEVLELDAKRRADEIESATRTRLTVFLGDVQQQYNSLVTAANTAATHASAELHKLEVTLSQLPLAFDAGKVELEKLEKSVYSAEE